MWDIIAFFHILYLIGISYSEKNFTAEIFEGGNVTGQELLPNQKDEPKKDYRKHYFLSLNDRCPNYVKTFQCLKACKSIGYQVFRMDWSCQCTCHEMKTTTLLPFFKWHTNGTTRKIPRTKSIKLYEIVGTLSPPPPTPWIDDDSYELTCPPAKEENSTQPATTVA